jgi:type IV pilus assembly protein PilM
MGFLSSSTNSFLGIDIGGTSIKIVELKKENGQAKLVSYGFSENANIDQVDWQNNPVLTAKIINKICSEAGLQSRSAVSALPTFSVFSSVLNLSNISKKDIEQNVQWEAKKIIPLPLEEMILDWKNIEDTDNADIGNFRLLLTGAPRQLVKKFITIFKEAKINLLSLETETFSLVRSLIGNDKSTIMLVELGANTTDISIVDRSIPMLNRSIDIGGKTITRDISGRLNMAFSQAEQFKYDLGVSSMDSKQESVPEIVVSSLAPIVNEIKYAMNLFQNKYGKKTEKIILSGGSALLPNIPDYLAKILDTKVIIGDPWARISYPADLTLMLNEIGPKMSVAIGLALREIE